MRDSAHTLRLFPLLSFSADGFPSRVPSPLGPMLLLRVLRDFFGDGAAGALKDEPAISPSAMFSLVSSLAMLRDCVRGGGDSGGVVVARFRR